MHAADQGTECYGEPPKNLREAVMLPFQIIAAAAGAALLVLGFIFLYKLGD